MSVAAAGPPPELAPEFSGRSNNFPISAGPVNPSLRSRMTRAAAAGDVEALEALVRRGADPMAPDRLGEVPLHLAAQCGHVSMVSVLLTEYRVPVDVPNWEGWTPLCWATVNSHVEIAKLLIKRGASVKWRTTWGWTPLHLASMMGHEIMVNMLIEEGAEADALAVHGSTPVSVASNHGMQTLLTTTARLTVLDRDNSGAAARREASEGGAAPRPDKDASLESVAEAGPAWAEGSQDGAGMRSSPATSHGEVSVEASKAGIVSTPLVSPDGVPAEGCCEMCGSPTGARDRLLDSEVIEQFLSTIDQE